MTKRILVLAIALLAIFGLMVSCKNEVSNAGFGEELVSVSFKEDMARGLTATLEGFDKDHLYWAYAAEKADGSNLISGETDSYDEAGAVWVKTDGYNKPVEGLGSTGTSGYEAYKVSGFSQGYWNFKLYAYKGVLGDNPATTEVETDYVTGYVLVYQGETLNALLKSDSANTQGSHLVSVIVDPVQSQDNGTMVFLTNKTHPAADRISMNTVNSATYGTNYTVKVLSILSIEDSPVEYVDAAGAKIHEATDSQDGEYTLPAGSYKVTVAFTDSASAPTLNYARGTIVATVYSNLTTTISGDLTEAMTYAEFDGELNPDLETVTISSEAITYDEQHPTTQVSFSSTGTAKAVTATTTKAVTNQIIQEIAATNGTNTTEYHQSLVLTLNVETVESTATTATYEIGMSATLTSSKSGDPDVVTTSDVSEVDEHVTIVLQLQPGLDDVNVLHDGHQMAEFPATDAGYGVFSYDKPTGELTIVTKSFSPFSVSFTKPDVTTYVAQVGNVKYQSLAVAIVAAKEDGTDTITLLNDVSLLSATVINKKVVLDLAGYTIAAEAGLEASVAETTIKNGSIVGALTVSGSNIGLSAVTVTGSVDVSGSAVFDSDCSVTGTAGVAYAIKVTGSIAIEGGTYAAAEGENKYILSGNATISDGNFKGTLTENTSVSLMGGIYEYDVSDFVADGYRCDNVSAGVFTIRAKADVLAGTELMTFIEFRESVNTYGNTYEGQTVKLLRDIDLTGVAWTPIGIITDIEYSINDSEYSSVFKGVFDGNNHTISNLSHNGSDYGFGLFGNICNATIKNLKLSNVNIVAGKYAGTLVASVAGNSLIENVDVSGSITGTDNTGCLVASYMSASISADLSLWDKLVIKDCDLTITHAEATSSSERIGGFVGVTRNGTERVIFDNDTFNGSIEGNRASYFIGHDMSSVVETTTSVTTGNLSHVLVFKDCTVSGTLTGDHTAWLIGFETYSDILYIENCSINDNLLCASDTDYLIGQENDGATKSLLYFVNGVSVGRADYGTSQYLSSLTSDTYILNLDSNYNASIVLSGENNKLSMYGTSTPGTSCTLLFEYGSITGTEGSILKCVSGSGNNASWTVGGQYNNFYDCEGKKLTAIYSGYYDLVGNVIGYPENNCILFNWDSELKGWKLDARYAERYGLGAVRIEGSSYTGPEFMLLPEFRDRVNGLDGYDAFSFEGCTVSLTYDVDLEGANWTPIGTEAHPFRGLFNGNGYTISNFIVSESNYYAALFGYVEGVANADFVDYRDIWIDNKLDESRIVESKYSAAIKNLNVSGANCSSIKKYAAGLVAFANDTYIYNCSVAESTILTGKVAGGLIGAINGCIVKNCTTAEDVSVTATSYHAGGLIGAVNYYNGSDHYPSPRMESAIISSTNSSTITNANNGGDGGAFGGIIALFNAATDYGSVVYDCENKGNITIDNSNCSSQYHSSIGGIVGSGQGIAVLSDCKNSGSVTVVSNYNSTGTEAYNKVGGIIGQMGNTAKIVGLLNCVNSADISATVSSDRNIIGGLVASISPNSSQKACIINCANSGTVTCKDSQAKNKGYVSNMVAEVYNNSGAVEYRNMQFGNLAALSDAIPKRAIGYDNAKVVIDSSVIVTDKSGVLTISGDVRRLKAYDGLCTHFRFEGSLLGTSGTTRSAYIDIPNSQLIIEENETLENNVLVLEADGMGIINKGVFKGGVALNGANVCVTNAATGSFVANNGNTIGLCGGSGTVINYNKTNPFENYGGVELRAQGTYTVSGVTPWVSSDYEMTKNGDVYTVVAKNN